MQFILNRTCAVAQSDLIMTVVVRARSAVAAAAAARMRRRARCGGRDQLDVVHSRRLFIRRFLRSFTDRYTFCTYTNVAAIGPVVVATKKGTGLGLGNECVFIMYRKSSGLAPLPAAQLATKTKPQYRAQPTRHLASSSPTSRVQPPVPRAPRQRVREQRRRRRVHHVDLGVERRRKAGHDGDAHD